VKKTFLFSFPARHATSVKVRFLFFLSVQKNTFVFFWVAKKCGCRWVIRSLSDPARFARDREEGKKVFAFLLLLTQFVAENLSNVLFGSFSHVWPRQNVPTIF
jgi:hypothetical protein